MKSFTAIDSGGRTSSLLVCIPRLTKEGERAWQKKRSHVVITSGIQTEHHIRDSKVGAGIQMQTSHQRF